MSDAWPILIVDDESEFCNSIAEILESSRFPTLMTTSAAGAYELLESRKAKHGEARIQAIVCDWKMPDMDGIELLRKIRGGPFRDIPFILMSGAVVREELLSAAKEGTDALLLKPFPSSTLFRELENAIIARGSKSAQKK